MRIGDGPAGKFSVLCFLKGRLIAVESIDSPGDLVVARRIFSGAGGPSAVQASASHFALKAWDATHRDPPAAAAA